jgi:hypothetical protein
MTDADKHVTAINIENIIARMKEFPRTVDVNTFVKVCCKIPLEFFSLGTSDTFIGGQQHRLGRSVSCRRASRANTDTKHVICKRKSIKAAIKAYNEKIYTAGMGVNELSRNAMDSLVTVSNIDGLTRLIVATKCISDD